MTLQFLPSYESFKDLAVSPKSLALTVAAGAIFLYQLYRKRERDLGMKAERPGRLVVITGCDSGLGLSMAVWTRRMGYKVFAGVLNPEGPGAAILQQDGVSFAKLDVTKEDSIREFHEKVKKYRNETRTELWTIIYNAAILICGECLWQTTPMLEMQMDVNFWGAVRLLREMKGSMLKAKCRYILISSDCSKVPLPGLAAYSASKSSLENWGRALRLELAKYGVTVTSYQPGSFAFASQIFSNQDHHFAQMEAEMSPTDKTFYGFYFQKWKQMKSALTEALPPVQVLNSKRHEQDLQYLLEGDIRKVAVLVYETWIQSFLYWADRYFPKALGDTILTTVMNGSNAVSWEKKEYPNEGRQESSFKCGFRDTAANGTD